MSGDMSSGACAAGSGMQQSGAAASGAAQVKQSNSNTQKDNLFEAEAAAPAFAGGVELSSLARGLEQNSELNGTSGLGFEGLAGGQMGNLPSGPPV